MFDAEAFRTWGLGAYRKAPDTVRGTMQRVRAMQAVGLDVADLLRDPGRALAQGYAALAAMKTAGGSPDTARSCGKALNWLVDYAKHLQPGLAWVRFSLEPERRRTPAQVGARDLEVLARHVGETRYITRLRRALLAVAVATRLRRVEVARLRVKDLRQAAGEVWVEYPAKRGPKRAIVVPASLWRPGGPLVAYLAVREPVGDALWTVPAGRGVRRAHRLTTAAVGRQLWRMGHEDGIPLSFVRTRRFGATLLDDLGVHPRVIQHQLGHASLTWTLRYLGEVGKDRILADYVRCGVPGFEAVRLKKGRRERLRSLQAAKRAVRVVLTNQA